MKRDRVLVLGVLLLTVGAVVGCVRPDPPPPDARVRARTLQPLAGHRYGQANDVNDRGEAVGWSMAGAAGPYRAVIWRSGRAQDLLPSSTGSAMAWAVNERSQVVLTGTVGFNTVAYRWDAGQVTDLSGGASYSMPMALNDRGQVLVRRSWSGIGAPAPVYRYDLWSDGGFTEIVPPGRATIQNGSALKLLDDGTVVGTARGAPFVWRDGEAHALAPAGTVVDANERGEVLGTIGTGPVLRTVLWHDGTETTVDPGEEGAIILPYDLSEDGRVAGQRAQGDGHEAVVWQDGRLTSFGPGRFAELVNERGDVVGSTPGAGGAFHALVWIDGRAVDLGAESFVHALNGHGQFVGSLGDGDGDGSNGEQGDAVLWTVVDN